MPNVSIGVECPPDLKHIDIRDAWERGVVLTERDWNVLRIIHEADQQGLYLGPTAIGKRLGRSANVASASLDRLALAGFIRWQEPVTQTSPYVLRYKERLAGLEKPWQAKPPPPPVKAEVWTVRFERVEGVVQTIAMAASLDLAKDVALAHARAKANGAEREILIPWEEQPEGRWLCLIGDPRRRDLARWYVVERWRVITSSAALQAFERQLQAPRTPATAPLEPVAAGARG